MGIQVKSFSDESGVCTGLYIYYIHSYMYVYELPYVQNENPHQGRGVFLSLPMHRKPSFLGGTNLLWCFFRKKDLECSTLCQAGIVYKKESI